MSTDTDENKWPFLALLIALAAIPLRGWAFGVLWGWFVVPLGVRSIGAAQALGFGCLAMFFQDLGVTRKKESMWVGAWRTVLVPVVALAIGYLCKAAMP